MSKLKVGDEVLVCLSQNVTKVLEVLTRTDHRGNVTTLYRLEGRPQDVLYMDEDLVKYVKPAPKKPNVTNEAKSAPVNSNITVDTSPATPDIVASAVLNSYIIDDEPVSNHHYSTPSHDTYHHSPSNDGGSYDSGSSDSSSSSSPSD
jgi:hypothetical protein